VLVHVAGVSALIVLALAHAPLWALLAVAVPTGASTPQVGPMVRARWAAKLGGTPLMPTAAAFESVTDEFTFVVGPVLATALCTGIHPAAGLIAEAVLSLAGGLLFASQRRTQPPVHRGASDAHPRVSALSIPGVRVLIVAFLGIGSVFGGMQVSLTALTESIGQPGLNGVLYGVFAGGNMLAGIACGAIAWKIGPRRRLLVAYGLLSGGKAQSASNWALVVFAVLSVLTVGTVGCTPGKRLLGLRVVSEGGGRITLPRVVLRTVLLVLVIPAAIWDRDGRGLHDRLSRSVQVRI
ncbi:MFS transporter, partial [Streptomyces sp. NPDC056405]|uniref:MFS transporter n=1 Tax=Streptomyces sp. NPDC056405 TaxID=3345811 RepID=UPI0035E1976C